MLIKDAARIKANEVLAEYWDGRFPIDPVRIASTLGMGVWYADLPGNESGRIVKQEGQPAQIYLANSEPPGRQNFTAAHELGHWFERSERNDTEYSFVDSRDDFNKNAHEHYADHFAANLLMPAKHFIDAIDQGCSAQELARRFGVTPTAARNRARLLGVALG